MASGTNNEHPLGRCDAHRIAPLRGATYVGSGIDISAVVEEELNHRKLQSFV